MRSCLFALAGAALTAFIGYLLMPVLVPHHGGPEGGSNMDEGLYLIFGLPIFAFFGLLIGGLVGLLLDKFKP